MTKAPHAVPIDISFKHCDPAGMVFYPRYVEMFNDAIEHWFQHALGCGFAELHGARGLAIPVVDLKCSFQTPSRLGDTLVMALGVLRVGRSSFTVALELRPRQQRAEPRVKAELTAVFVDMVTLSPVPIPGDLRTAIGPGVAGGTAS